MSNENHHHRTPKDRSSSKSNIMPKSPSMNSVSSYSSSSYSTSSSDPTHSPTSHSVHIYKQGKLKKKSFWSSWKEVWCTVDTSPYLMEFKAEGNNKPSKIILLPQYVLRLAQNITGVPNTFALFSTKSGKDPLFFLAQDEPDMIEWTTAMRKHTQPSELNWETDTVIEAFNDAVVIASEKGVILNVNNSCLELFGYASRDDLIGKSINVFMPPSMAEKHGQYMANYFESGIKRLIGVPRNMMAMKADGTPVAIILSLGEQEGQRRFIATMRPADKLKNSEKSTLDSTQSAVEQVMLKAQKDMKETLKTELDKINTIFEQYRSKNNELQLQVNKLEKERKLRTETTTSTPNKRHSKKEKKDRDRSSSNAAPIQPMRSAEIDLTHVMVCERLSEGPGGSGAMVYSCLVDGWMCAMKEFSIQGVEDALIEGIVTEISLLESLPYHRNLVRYLFHHITETRVRLFMTKYACNLTGYIKRLKKDNQSFTEHHIVKLLLDIVRGLDLLHQHNVMHRDLKSDNIFVTLNMTGEIDCLSIGDFDTAKLVSNLNVAKTIIGTPGYIAPEILKGKNKTEYSFAVDVWSLGMVLYELMTLKRPFEEASVLEVTRLNENGYLPDIPSELQQNYQNLMPLFKKCLSVNPEDRPTIKEIKEILSQL